MPSLLTGCQRAGRCERLVVVLRRPCPIPLFETTWTPHGVVRNLRLRRVEVIREVSQGLDAGLIPSQSGGLSPPGLGKRAGWQTAPRFQGDKTWIVPEPGQFRVVQELADPLPPNLGHPLERRVRTIDLVEPRRDQSFFGWLRRGVEHGQALLPFAQPRERQTEETPRLG
jgi:hypothetical protein